MARSLSSVKAFFQGLDDGTAQRRLEEEAAAKRKLEDQNFLFKTAAEQRAIEDQAQRGEIFALGKTSRELAVKKAEFEAGQFLKNTPVLEADADITRTKAMFGQNLFKTNQTEIEKNIFDATKNKLGQDALGIDQANARLEQMKKNPALFDKELRAMGATRIAAGEDPATVAKELNITIPTQLAVGADGKPAGIVDQFNFVKDPVGQLTAMQKAVTTQQQDTELFNRETAASLEKAELARIAKEGQNATPQEILQRQGHQAGMAAMRGLTGQAAQAAYNNAKANVVVSAAAPAAVAAPAAATTQTPSQRLGITLATLPPAAPLPTPAMPTAPAKAAPAPVAQPAPILTPGEQAVDNARVAYARLQKEVEDLQPPPYNGRNNTRLLAWRASGKEALLQAKQAELQRAGKALVTPRTR